MGVLDSHGSSIVADGYEERSAGIGGGGYKSNSTYRELDGGIITIYGGTVKPVVADEIYEGGAR